MAQAIRFTRTHAAQAAAHARALIVSGCALALICAGRALPF